MGIGIAVLTTPDSGGLGDQGTTMESGPLGTLLPHAFEATRFRTYVPLETAPLRARLNV